MHEVSLVRNMLSTLEDQFSVEEMSRLIRVQMQVGALANVEPILMQNAFEAVKQDNPKYKDVELQIEWVDVQIYCEICDKNSAVEGYRFVCECGRPSSDVVSGKELLIKEVEFSELVA